MARSRSDRATPHKLSAGILLYRRREGVEVLLVHPGGPFWRRKDADAWSIPKGLVDGPDEDIEAAARREFCEEVGAAVDGPLHPLGEVRQTGGKVVIAFAAEGEADAAAIPGGGLVTLEWPRGSGRSEAFPEVDRAAWFALAEARVKLLASQHPLLDRLEALLSP
ncbi:NUDIX domain-containing protein [Acuticoccus kandeliae]|uniref:NUDIX domain-containing protein n=1 Tax=Acuticoccus kandeliae TaxID=2073160 RepID=UPI000D3E3F72|nr:NUDIX domain-containing protein [Acuticoccus kandeliae]